MSPSRREPPAPIPAPRLPGAVVARADLHDLLDELSSDMLAHAINCAQEFGSFHIALSGGSTPIPFYERLMLDPLCRRLPWSMTHLWIVDERRVPFDDERSNFASIRETIVEHSGIPESHVHPIRAVEDDADLAYERELVELLGARGPGRDRLDFVLLGMGADCHTASLFPGSPALKETRRLVRINDGPSVTPPDRVTMTYPLLNAARLVAALVTGIGKREALGRVSDAYARAGEDRSRRLAEAESAPIVGVQPYAGDLRWYLDAGAAGA